ncbi:hypothetical protein QFC22_004111 [Naganishia vaughanmartiniae]|uniref:Uncharacterized protein n=1 Tax=Naganishia vaughanmartiniae TaxID=1424756 RepID=A0ACC2X3N2_9TREE|nr:hypothetical protein QFC22_004111 [Naganishia vaughanmartiniae]
MTSRLRKKLQDLDDAGSNLNESFCLIGTPLPSLADTKRDQNEFVPVWKQEARLYRPTPLGSICSPADLSLAGYYNSVGSKEGWAPAAFKSSRQNRAGNSGRQQTAEDFMDEEDLADLRDSRKLENTETFKSDGFTSTADELGRSESIGSALTSLIQPASSSVGQKLLMKMGWRPGQGIGPRVSARKRKIQEAKILGRRTGPKAGDVVVDEEEQKHLFAPRDSKLMVFEQKAGKEGLGFVKGQGMRPIADRSSAQADKPNLSAGFGLGIDEADEDDMDIYNSDSIQPRHDLRMAYDLADQDDDIVLLGSGSVGVDRSQRRKPLASEDDGRTFKKPRQAEERRDGNVWNDGKPVLPGFMIDPKATTQDKWFDFPSIPDDWRPRPARVWHRGSKWDQKEVVQPSVQNVTAEKRSQLTADQRGDILGEEQLQTAQKSIFDYMSAKSKERLAQATNTHQSTGVSLTVEDEGEAGRQGVVVPPLSPRTASAALKGFVPFADDPAKQERYKSYLVSQTLNTADPNPRLLPGRPVNEVNKELSDFSKSASMFKPMSFAMANRFTSSTMSVADLVQPKPGLHIPDPDKLDEWKDTSKTESEVKEVLTPRQEAARAGMYGKMTRTEDKWAPNKLLCKRFGVADPYPDGLPGTTAAATTAKRDGQAMPAGGTFGTRPLLTAAAGQDVAWQDKFTNVSSTATATEEASSLTAAGDGSGPRQPKTLAEVGLADDVNQGRETLTYKKPEIDIFKAIFADDDDDGDDDDGDDDGGEERNDTDSRLGMAAVPPPSKLHQPSLSLPSANELNSVTNTTTDDSYAPYRPVFALPPATKRDRDDIENGSSGAKDRSRDTDGGKSKKVKRGKKDKKANKILMSFDVGDDDGEEDEGMGKHSRDGDKSKKEKTRREEGIEEEQEWIEKEIVIPSTTTSKRKRAEDFL